MEWALTVPPRLTQVAYRILVDAHCVPRPWNLDGRYGSRTHKHGTDRMAIPILSAARVEACAKTDKVLDDFLRTTDEHGSLVVEMVYKEYTVSNRAHEPPPFDARIHPERAPRATLSSLVTLPVRTEHPTPEPTDTATFTFAELFAGIGGFGVALEALGGECIFCSELEESCRELYAANLHVADENLHGDIYEVTDGCLPETLDLLVCGFPCQPFSSLGQQPGFGCPKGHLFLEIVRVLDVSKPKAFILENVPGLVQMSETLQIIVSSLENAGYVVTTEICDARCLTATSRKRLYFVGLRRADDGDVGCTCSTQPFEFPFVPDLGLRARNVIDYEPLTAKLEELLRVSDQQLRRMDTEKYWRPAHLAWPNCIVDTLVSHYGNSVARGHSQLVPALSCSDVTTFSANPRRFTPRECARIMGFPEAYVLPDSKDPAQGAMSRTKELYCMLGNAVCPPMIAAIAGAVLDRCPGIRGYNSRHDWVAWGRTTAVRLANEATMPSRDIVM